MKKPATKKIKKTTDKHNIKDLREFLEAYNMARYNYSTCQDAPKKDQAKLASDLNKAHSILDKAIHLSWCDAFDE